jgi:hypothetical protein
MARKVFHDWLPRRAAESTSQRRIFKEQKRAGAATICCGVHTLGFVQSVLSKRF